MKEANPSRVIPLIENHGVHYLPEAMAIHETYIGFQDRYAFQIRELLQRMYTYCRWVTSGSTFYLPMPGVTNTWLHHAGYEGEPLDQFINALFKYQPRQFFFNGRDPYGNDVT